MTYRLLPRIAIATLATAVPTLAACGDDDNDTTASVAPTSSPHAGHPTVAIGLRDYAFDDVPATITAGTTIAVTNTSTKEIHELIAIRLPDDEQRTLDELAALTPPELQQQLDTEPAAVLVAPPGHAGIAVVGDGTLDEPGRYLLVCMIPTGADPQAYLDAASTATGPPRVDGGPPHVTSGMIAEVHVTG